MLIKPHRGWVLSESEATPERTFMNRRTFISGSSAVLLGSMSVNLLGCEDSLFWTQSKWDENIEPDPTADLYPLKRNPAFKADRPITKETLASTYNNFIEFGSNKLIFRRAQALKLRPWEIHIDGEVEKPLSLGIDEFIRKMPLEERVYRHRCVEAWSMVVPWTGFPLSELVKLAQPLSSAKYLRMETFNNPSIAGGQRVSGYPWPYSEGVTMAEAANELAFLVTGVFGKPLAKQFGAPLRLALPWKYGFKSIKSIVRFTFTKHRPKSFWEKKSGDEYGFWANVNPDVPHPRWSQKTERDLDTRERIPTRIYNGYGAWVADLYKDIKGEKLFM